MARLLVPFFLLSVALPLAAQTYQGVEEAPEGTNWIADQASRQYYPLSCALAAQVPMADRLYFATESAVRQRGFTRSLDCAGTVRLQDEPPLASPPAQVAVPTASNQVENRQQRRGFWFSGGLGYGSLGCQDCGSREGGLSGGIQLGGTLSQKVLLGVGTSGWAKEENGVTLTVGTLVAMIRFYPSSTGGFFLLGGLGAGSIYAKVDGFGENTETGGGALLGLGYDARIGSNVSLTPYWNGFAVSASGSDANVGQLGLAITIH